MRQLPAIGVFWMEIEHKNQISTLKHDNLTWMNNWVVSNYKIVRKKQLTDIINSFQQN